MRARYEKSSVRISSIIIASERIFRWGRTRRSYERFSRQKWGRLCRCRKSVGCTTATNDRLPEKSLDSLCYALHLLGPLKFAPKLALWVVHISEFRSSDSGAAASRLSLRFVLKIRRDRWTRRPYRLTFPLTESDIPLLKEPCPHTRWSGLQIHCKREGPHEVRRAERIQRESSSLHARSSPGRGVAAGYTGAKRAS